MNDLEQLGAHIAQLRIERRLKQSELAYEAGISHRTLQRLEAGEVVKTDGLLRVIARLDRLDGLMSSLASEANSERFSPYAIVTQANKKPKPAKRVRRSKKASGVERRANIAGSVVWPEDE